MNERQRELLLERIHRQSGTLGGSVPETLTLEGESVPLREFYLDLAGREELSDSERERADEILSYLRRERLALVQQIENDEVDFDRGQELVETVRGLDRAIDAFESLDEPDLGEQLRRKEVQSARELVDMLRQFGRL